MRSARSAERDRPRLLVVGAGVVGASLTYRLARAGADVTVVDRGRVGGGTTDATFSVDVTTRKTPRSHFELGRLAIAEHRRLGEQLGGAGWVHPAPIVEWAEAAWEQSVIETRRRRVTAWGVRGDRVGLAELAELEPRLAPAKPDDVTLVLYREGTWYQPRKLARLALAAARRLGAELVEHDPIVSMRRHGSKVVRVTAASGRSWRPGTIVNCAGAAAGTMARLAGARLPLTVVPGVVVTTAPSGHDPLRTIVLGARANVRAAGGRRHVLHSYAVDARLGRPGTHPRLVELGVRVLEEAARIVPSLRDEGIERVAVGARPVPPDGLPLVGETGDLDNLYTVVTHSGALLGPGLSRLAATELLTGSDLPSLDEFRPARLADGRGKQYLDESTRQMQALLDARA